MLVAVMLLGLVACGSINETEVSILWSGDGIVRVPNSLINAMERAMYIENIEYKHYGANGDQAVQTAQAKAALDAGCAALAVELLDADAAQEILDAAKTKNVPVVFFNCQVDSAVVATYSKAVCIYSDAETVSEIQGEQIFEAIVTEKKEFFFFNKTFVINEDVDRNKDSKISYLGIGDVAATVASLNKALVEKGLPELVTVAENAEASYISGLTAVDGKTTKEKGQLVTADGRSVELIITANDVDAKDVLLALQAHGFNSTKLTTHAIPVYTVGNTFDYKSFVMATMPDAPYSMDTDDKAESKAMDNWWNSQEVTAWKDANATICSLYSVDWSDLDEFLYVTTDVIGAARLTGTAMIDFDAVSAAVAGAIADLLGGDVLKSLEIKVPYTTN